MSLSLQVEHEWKMGEHAEKYSRREGSLPHHISHPLESEDDGQAEKARRK